MVKVSGVGVIIGSREAVHLKIEESKSIFIYHSICKRTGFAIEFSNLEFAKLVFKTMMEDDDGIVDIYLYANGRMVDKYD